MLPSCASTRAAASIWAELADPQAYLSKPFRPRELIAKIRELLDRR